MDLRSDRMLSTMQTTSHDFVRQLDYLKQKSNALGAVVTSINPYNGSATILCSDSGLVRLESQVIYCPNHVRLMLPMTQMSAPLNAGEFTLPNGLYTLADKFVVVCPINDLQGLPVAVLFVFFTSASLSVNQHMFLDIARQKVEIGLHHKLIYNPHSEKLTAQLSLLEEVSTISRVGAWECNRYSGEITATSVVKSLLGLEHLKFIYVYQFMELLDGKTLSALIKSMLTALKKEKFFVEYLNFKNASGQHKRVKLTVYLQTSENPLNSSKVTRFYGAVQDETEIQNLSDTQQNFTEYMTGLLNNVDGVVLSIDSGGTILTVNDQVESLLGFTPDELIGQDIKLITTKPSQTASASMLSERCTTYDALATSQTSVESMRHKSGKHITCEVSVKNLTLHHQELVVATLRNFTAQMHEIEHYKQLAFSDPVTGLYNTCFLEQYVRKQVISEDLGTKLCICIRISLESITEYEDAFGVPTVEYILRVFAGRFSRAFDDEFGDDYFVCKALDSSFYVYLKPYVNGDDTANDVIDNVGYLLKKHVLLPITMHNNALEIDAQIVSCTLPATLLSFKNLTSLLNIPVALRQTSSSRSNGEPCIYRIAKQDIERYSSIRHSLSQALAHGEFYLELQPQYDSEQHIINSEALLRWHHPQLGELSPAEFIPIAEESEVIAELDLWVCNETCKLLSDCLKFNIHTKLSMNISARHLARADFVSKFVSIVDKWHVPHDLITLELTESAIIKGIYTVQSRVRELANCKFNLSIDDFGIGDSNLNYLQDLPISELKVDKLFVEGMENSTQKRRLVQSICTMAKSLQLNIVAEGIENTSQLNHAKESGCMAFQGYYLDKPLSVVHWKEKLSTANTMH